MTMCTIRPATEGEVDAVLEFWRVATAEPSSTDDAASVRALIAHDPGALLVAVDGEGDGRGDGGDGGGGRIVGSVIAGWDGWRGTMYRLAVLPGERRRRIGTELVLEGERRLGARGAQRLHLVVSDVESAAGAFWHAAGYRSTEQARFVKTFGDGPHAMEKAATDEEARQGGR